MNKEQVKKKYIAIAKILKRSPSVADCIYYGVTRHMIRHHFGNITNLQKLTGLEHQEIKKQNKEKQGIYKILGVKDSEKE